MNFLHDSTLFVIDTHQNMPFSLILTPFDHFQIRPTFAVTPNLILEPRRKQVIDYINFNVTTTDNDSIQILLVATISEKQHLFLLIE